jgi:4'-phosphopantetheinyl transferase
MIEPGEIHVWTAYLSSSWPEEVISDSLVPEELEKARSFRFPKARQDYLVAHYIMRHILSEYVALRANQLHFRLGKFGKPFLVNSGNRFIPYFNLSHSGSLLVVALSRDRRIGIDVEKIRGLEDLAEIARANFTERECAYIMERQGKERESAFFRCWTRKESYIKALGKGLSIPLTDFDTLLESVDVGLWLLRTSEAPAVEKWWLTDIALPDGYAGSVTVERGLDCLVQRHWQKVHVL